MFMKLSDVIVLERKFARSVNLKRDHGEAAVIDSYQVTAKAQEVMERFVAALRGENISAWSLVGPYGMGKSSFFNFFLNITGPDSCVFTKKALHKLESVNMGLYGEFTKAKRQIAGKDGFFRIPIISSFEPINNTLARGLRSALPKTNIAGKDVMLNELDAYMQDTQIKPTFLLDSYQKVAKSLKAPLLIIIDELGKNLEYLSYHYHEGDLFILQQLAEMRNIYLWVSLHQAFQEYMPSFSVVQQQEWNKVQGRFEEISFVESAAQMLFLAEMIISNKSGNNLANQIESWAKGVKNSMAPIDMEGKNYFADIHTIKKLYPFHPITILALVELCRKYAQNERTLTSFLCSGHDYALPAKLEKMVITDNEQFPAIGLEALYAYFFQLGSTILAHTPKAQRWLEIRDIIQTTTQLTEKESILIHNIGVLNLLTGYLGLKASPETLTSIMEYVHGWPPEEIKTRLNALIQRGIIFKREYSNEFRLWEGSDFDVNEAIAKEKAKLSLGSLEEILEKHLPLSPIIAARHSLKKGTLRRFERRWVDHETLQDRKFNPGPNFDGLLLYCFGTRKELDDNLPSGFCDSDKPLLIIYAPIKETLKELVAELIACRFVLERYPQMISDKVARKEVNFRYRLAKERFREYSKKVFLPNRNGLISYAGENKRLLHNRRELSAMLSTLCDVYYKDAPVIANEIISGEKLSGIASRARRELVEAMATRANEENLGFTGLGPEVAIYRSLILTKGLHKPNTKTGLWYLTLQGNDANLSRLWSFLDHKITNADHRGITIEKMIEELREPPFGLRQGPSLIYISLYLLVESENLIVFCEDAYKPYLTSADMALLLKRPDLFTVKRFTRAGLRSKIFSAYKNVLGVSKIKDNTNIRNATMLGIVGPLMQFIDGLPHYTKQTKTISQRAQRVRFAISNAEDPLQLLFEELPKALGLHMSNINASPHIFEERLQSVLAEINGAYSKLKQELEEVFLEKFNAPNTEEAYKSLSQKTHDLLDHCNSIELKPLLRAMARKENNLGIWLEGIAGAILRKPVDIWDDIDLQLFKARLIDYIDRIEQLAVLTKISPTDSDVYIISVMEANGNIERQTVRLANSNTKEVRKVLKDVSELTPEGAKAVLAVLAKKVILGGNK